MAKKKASQRSKANKKPSPKSTSVLSVRFSTEETAHIKEASELEEVAVATFVRNAAAKEAIGVINAKRSPRQSFAIDRLSKEVAKHLKGQGSWTRDYTDIGENGPYRDSVTNSGPIVEDSGFGDENITAITGLDDKHMRQLVAVLTDATQYFAEVLANDLLRQVDDPTEEEGFTPIITSSSGKEL